VSVPVAPWTDVEMPVDRWIGRALPELPDPVRAILSMLSYEERALLYELARQYQGHGAIVDAGCFVGGSSLSFAMGLAPNSTGRRSPIHTYDRFIFTPDMIGYAEGHLRDMEIGSSLLPVFEQNLASYRQAITLHEGDILEETWTGGSIEILFIDICKSWEINAHVVHEFFPSLIPEASVIVQQDLVHWKYPWCVIVMEYLSDYFEYLGWTWYASSVWKCIGLPPADALEMDWKRDVGLEPGLELLRRAAKRHTGWAVPFLELSRATLMHELGEDQAARDEIRRVKREYGTSVPYLEQAYRDLEDDISRAALHSDP
jgi:hypothetical protein